MQKVLFNSGRLLKEIYLKEIWGLINSIQKMMSQMDDWNMVQIITLMNFKDNLLKILENKIFGNLSTDMEERKNDIRWNNKKNSLFIFEMNERKWKNLQIEENGDFLLTMEESLETILVGEFAKLMEKYLIRSYLKTTKGKLIAKQQSMQDQMSIIVMKLQEATEIYCIPFANHFNKNKQQIPNDQYIL